MNTRTGKIARLPKQIREQLNTRLENGERGPAILKWLNELPEIQKLITEQFGGHPIRPQNLSQWRNGGYLDWTRHQLLREQTRWTAEQAAELGLDLTGNSISIAEDIATVMSAELALHVQALSAIKNPKQRFRQFRHLARELSRLRRDDQRAIRTQMRHPQRRPTLRPAEQPIPSSTPIPVGPDSVEPKLPPHASTSDPAILTTSADSASRLTVGDDVSSLKHPAPAAAPCRPEPEPPSSAPTPSLPQEERAGALQHALSTSVPDCARPLPLFHDNSQPPYNPPIPQPSIISSQPTTPPSPIPQNPTKTHHQIFSIPVRGRRFTCIEG